MPIPAKKKPGSTITPEFPAKFRPLFNAARYKICYGGRGGGRSWAIARWLLIEGHQKPMRILCARELQRSISDSVHALLSDQIKELGLQAHYEVQKSGIYGLNGTQFIFAGLKSNVDAIKSAEAVDRVWVEEAQNVSHASWEILIPTVRKAGSQIILSFNPELHSDDTYARFITHTPPDSITIKSTYRDNPWFPDVLKQEMEYLKANDYLAYLHVWEGDCLSTVEGAIYAKELGECEAAGHLTRIAYDPSRPVVTFWDLGYGDNTAIWFVQAYPWEYRCIDYLEGDRLPLAHYQKQIQLKPYIYECHCLPHDAQAKQLGTGKSVQELMTAAGFKVRIVPKLSILDGINAARTIFPQVWFDSERCADGIQALRHYRWAPPGTLGIQKREPLHDWASNAADGFRYFAVGIKPQLASKPKPAYPNYQPVSAWS